MQIVQEVSSFPSSRTPLWKNRIYTFQFQPLPLLCILCSFSARVSCPETLHSSPVHKVQLQEVAESTSFAIWTARLMPSSNKNQNHHNNNKRTIGKLPSFDTQLKPEGKKPSLALPRAAVGASHGPSQSSSAAFMYILNNLTQHCHLWKYLNHFLICK